jgi:hypothetical protein
MGPIRMSFIECLYLSQYKHSVSHLNYQIFVKLFYFHVYYIAAEITCLNNKHE